MHTPVVSAMLWTLEPFLLSRNADVRVIRIPTLRGIVTLLAKRTSDMVERYEISQGPRYLILTIHRQNPQQEPLMSVLRVHSPGKDDKTFDLSKVGLSSVELPADFENLEGVLLALLLRVHPHSVQLKAPRSDESSQAAAPAKDPAKVLQQLETFEVRQEDGPDLRFEGEMVCRLSEPFRNGRSFRLSLFKTKGGKFVGVSEGMSLWPGERTRSKVVIAETLEELPQKLGYSAQAKRLYQILKIDAVQHVD